VLEQKDSKEGKSSHHGTDGLERNEKQGKVRGKRWGGKADREVLSRAADYALGVLESDALEGKKRKVER